MRGKDVVEYAYDLIRNLPRVSRDTIAPFYDRRKKKKVIRGDSGPRVLKTRNTYFAIGSESKKTPFVLRFPKEKYYDKLLYKREYPPLSLRDLQLMIDMNRVDITKPIDLAALCRSEVYNIDPELKHYGVNLIDEGADIFQEKVNIEVQWASESAIAAVERNGGVIRTAYYDIRSLNALKNPKKFFEKGESIPRRLPPPEDAVLYYMSPENRGYLADPEQISWQRLVLAQKFGYKLPEIEKDPDYEMLMEQKDPRQIFYGLEPGWVVNLKERVILKSIDPTFNQFFKS